MTGSSDITNAIKWKVYIGFSLAYLHLTVAHSKDHGQKQFNCENLENWVTLHFVVCQPFLLLFPVCKLMASKCIDFVYVCWWLSVSFRYSIILVCINTWKVVRPCPRTLLRLWYMKCSTPCRPFSRWWLLYGGKKGKSNFEITSIQFSHLGLPPPKSMTTTTMTFEFGDGENSFWKAVENLWRGSWRTSCHLPHPLVPVPRNHPLVVLILSLCGLCLPIRPSVFRPPVWWDLVILCTSVECESLDQTICPAIDSSDCVPAQESDMPGPPSWAELCRAPRLAASETSRGVGAPVDFSHSRLSRTSRQSTVLHPISVHNIRRLLVVLRPVVCRTASLIYFLQSPLLLPFPRCGAGWRSGGYGALHAKDWQIWNYYFVFSLSKSFLHIPYKQHFKVVVLSFDWNEYFPHLLFQRTDIPAAI